MAGREENYRRLTPLLARATGELLLDTGAGTGEITRILDPTTRYLWLDNDVQKLSGFRAKNARGTAVVADVTQIPLANHSVHTALCVAVSHHLTDPELDQLFSELARVCRHQLVFLDALKQQDSAVSRWMWRYDRGSHPRTREHLLSMLGRYFIPEEIQHYSIYHRYLLCACSPVKPVRAASVPLS